MDGLLATLMNSILIPPVYKPLENVPERGPNYQILIRVWSWAWPWLGGQWFPEYEKCPGTPIYYTTQISWIKLKYGNFL